ncbi:MAG TPA: adenylate kinase [Roseateles sp.]
MRLVIIGNSGSGRTWLATRLGTKVAAPVVHLDEIFWLPGGFNEKRPTSQVMALVDLKRAGERWISEGVYGNLARQFMLCAPSLVWLDPPWEVCRLRLESRGSESNAHMGREQSEEGLRQLVEWAQSYGSRQGSSGRAAHLALFESFNGPRVKLDSERQVLEYLQAA